MLPTFVAILATASAVIAAPFIQHDGLLYADLKARQQNLPLLKLPYATYQAAKYDANTDIYTFKNIRFAEPPVGDLRFAAPMSPKPIEGIQTGAKGASCPQSIPATFLNMGASLLGGGNPDSGIGKMITSLGGSLMKSGLDLSSFMGGSAADEDCLFLDILVPSKALKGNVEKLPVINWIYGGSYIIGSKDQGYDGAGIVDNTKGNVVFVAANYRLGALGFLAGTTVEKEGTPNAGFHDQRAVLDWIQSNIHLVGGDKDRVTVWGESAGAGSIMHQLTAYGGAKPAPFNRAVLLSPAFHNQIDRRGQLEQQYKDFEKFGGCEDKGLACLRKLTFKQVKAANDKLIASQPPGETGWAPAVDGTFVRQHPILELVQNNVAKNIESVIVSHVSDEARMFVQDGIYNDADFYNLTSYDFGNTSSVTAVKDAISKQLMSPNVTGSPYKTQKERTIGYTQFSTFTCNTRFITEAFKNASYNLQYSRGTGLHGTDIGTAFFNAHPATGLAGLFSGGLGMLSGGDRTLSTFAPLYQNYLTSFSRTGDPNTFKGKDIITWPKAQYGPEIKDVMNAGDDGFKLITDKENQAKDCDFWRDAFAALTAIGGYAPPGSYVHSPLAADISEAAATANFKTP